MISSRSSSVQRKHDNLIYSVHTQDFPKVTLLPDSHRTRAYQRLRNVCLSEIFAYVLNEWSLVNASKILLFHYVLFLPLSIPPKKIRELDVFWWFQGVQTETSDMKWVNVLNNQKQSPGVGSIGRPAMDNFF